MTIEFCDIVTTLFKLHMQNNCACFEEIAKYDKNVKLSNHLMMMTVKNKLKLRILVKRGEMFEILYQNNL